jgi:site-specific DNA recombinase
MPAQQMPQNKKVVAYCRVSTMEQKKKGLGMDVQTRDVVAFAQQQDLSLDLIYKDEAESGAAESRKQLNRLRQACKRGEICVLIIPALDRLSRDVRIAEDLFWLFERYGVRVLIADMPHYDATNRRDVMIRQIREAIAEENRKDIIERLWKSRQERVRKGRTPGGNIPYGYRRDGKKFVPDVTESRIVRLIFMWHLEEKPASEIAVMLNEQGSLRRNGSPWIGRQVLDVIGKQDLYKDGVVRYGQASGINKGLVLLEERVAA